MRCTFRLRSLLCTLFALFGALSSSASSAETIDGISAASARLYADRPFRIGMIRLSNTIDVQGLVQKTVKHLQTAFYPYQIDIQDYSADALQAAVREGQVDAFIASSGFFWRMVPYGARDVATAISIGRPNPNKTSAIAFITRRDNTQIQSIEDMIGKRLSASYPTAFMGYRIGLAQIAAYGYDPERFFGSIEFTDNPEITAIAQKVLNHQADVAFVQSCWLETLPQEERNAFRVIAPIKSEDFSCARSTQAYPNITVGVLKNAPPGAAREMTRLLLTMSPDPEGNRWGLATDFQSVDQVYRLLKLEHYAYLRGSSFKRWVNEHRQWIAVGISCLLLLVSYSFIISYVVRRRTEQIEQTQREKELVQARLDSLYQRMEQVRKANIVSQLSSMIAHELAQPVGAAKSFTDGLRLLLADGRITKESLERSLNGLARSLLRVERIVQKVRSYSGGDVNRDQTLRLAEVVKTARESLPTALQQGLTPQVGVDSKLSILGDKLEMELLFNNLLSNAYAGAKQGSDPFVRISAQVDTEHIVVTVENSGKVMDEAAIEQITVPFVSENGAGHGLGVPIALSLAETNGGHLSFSAREGGGLMVSVTLRSACDTKGESQV